MREKLAPGGAVVVNVGHPEGNDDLERVIGRDDGERVPARSSAIRVEAANTLLLGTEEPRPRAERLLAALGDLPPDDLRDLAGRASEGRAAAPRRRGLHRRPGAGRVADRPLDPGIRGRGVGQERAAASRNGIWTMPIVDCAQYCDGVRQDTGPLSTSRRPPSARRSATGSSGSACTRPTRRSGRRSAGSSASTSSRSRTPAPSTSGRSSRTTTAPTSSCSRPPATTTSARRSTSARSTSSSARAT